VKLTNYDDLVLMLRMGGTVDLFSINCLCFGALYRVETALRLPKFYGSHKMNTCQ